MRFKEIKGAVHVHSRYSDGTGSVDEITQAAQTAGLDFVMLTDHDNMRAAEEGYEGYRDGVLVVVASEISPGGRGHCLAVGAPSVKGYRWMPERFFLRKLSRDGAETYIAHPEGRVKPTFGINLREWHAWQDEKFTGLEIWSYMHDWVDSLTYLNLPRYYRCPDRAIDGPDRRVLGLWDRLNVHRRVVGIGALDAHAVKLVLGLFVAFPYEFLFRTVLTHVLVEDWGRGSAQDISELRRSLKAGRAFVSYEAEAEATGFCFETGDGAAMGERLGPGDGRSLVVSTPREASIDLLRNGRLVETREGHEALFEVREPGVYRIEARLNGRPWIFSNPIVLEAEDDEHRQW